MRINPPLMDISPPPGAVSWHDVASNGMPWFLRDGLADGRNGNATPALSDLLQLGPRLAPRLLRELADRPVGLVTGVAHTLAALHVVTEGRLGEWLGLRRLPAAPSAAPRAPRLALDDEEALLCAWRGGALELRTAHTRQGHAHPNRLVFDLDPGPRTPWARMLQVAALLRAALDAMALRSLLKTSGARGLHVVVPIAPEWPAAALVGVAEAAIAHWSRRFPDRIAARPSQAEGRVVIDPRCNAAGATLVAAYSLRAQPGLGVSMPVRWNELCALSGGDHWTLASLPRRIEELGDIDPWAGEGARPQSLRPMVQALGLPVPKSLRNV